MRKPLLAILPFFAILPSAFAAKSACIPPKDALGHAGKKVCVAAHIYRVVDKGKDAHFFDVCSPKTPDEDCRFFILSFSKDKKSIAYLHGLAGRDIRIRGAVHALQGRAEMILSDPDQLRVVRKKSDPGPHPDKDFSADRHWRAFRPRNGRMGQDGVHFGH